MSAFLFLMAHGFIACYSTIVDYRFSNNIGQIFYDYSGNNNHAVNGESHLDKLSDISYSDRGIYFSNDKQVVRLPPNTLVTTGITLTSPFSIVLWFYIFETSNNIISIYRRHLTTDLGKRFLIARDTDHNLKYF